MNKTTKLKPTNQPAQDPAHQPKLSAQDFILKRFLQLKDQIKPLEKELKAINEDLKHQGTHSTHNYVVIIAETSVDAYMVKAHVKRSVKVSRKEQS